MTGDRTEEAVQRIEAALARIAAAAERAPSPGEPAQPARSESVIALVEKHEALRETVAQAIGELDDLLGELDQ